MGAQIDEGRLRQLFDAMTADQPAAPPDRYRGIQRRVTRRRWALAAGSLTFAAVIAASGIGAGLSATSHQAAGGSRPVPSWALPWPDHRNGSVPQRVLDQAVLAWRHLGSQDGIAGSVITPGQIIWYAGQTVAHGQVVAVIFEADAPAGPRLVAGWATASEVMHGQPGWSDSQSPWVLYSVPAPSPGRRHLAIGLNVHGSVTTSGQNPDNWIFELTAPVVQTLVVQVRHPAKEVLGAYTTVGLLIRDAGQITEPVKVALESGQPGNRISVHGAEPVAVPGNPASAVPQLALPAPLSVARLLVEYSGQGDQSDENKGMGLVGRVVARCYGPAPLRITIGDTKMRVIGTIPCDNAQHELRLRGGQQRAKWLNVLTSDLTSYLVALARH